MESEPMFSPREKSPLPEAQRRIKPRALHHTGQWAQHTTDWAILSSWHLSLSLVFWLNFQCVVFDIFCILIVGIFWRHSSFLRIFSARLCLMFTEHQIYFSENAFSTLSAKLFLCVVVVAVLFCFVFVSVLLHASATKYFIVQFYICIGDCIELLGCNKENNIYNSNGYLLVCLI